MALNPSQQGVRAAAVAAANEVAEVAAMEGEHPALIRKRCKEVLGALPADVVGPIKENTWRNSVFKTNKSY